MIKTLHFADSDSDTYSRGNFFCEIRTFVLKKKNRKLECQP